MAAKPLAGDIIRAGFISRIVDVLRRDGDTLAGRSLSRRILRDEFPTVARPSIEAVLTRAREAIQIGRNYERAGPNYTPKRGDFPTSIGLPSQGVSRQIGGPMGNDSGVFYRIRGMFETVNLDGSNSTAPIDVIVQRPNVLSKSDLETAGREALAQIAALRSVRTATNRYPEYVSQISMQIVGAWIR
jgi:hypothetical protein